MLKQIAWNTFKNTGDINTFMELTKVEKAMEDTINNEKSVLNNLDINQEYKKIDTIVKL